MIVAVWVSILIVFADDGGVAAKVGPSRIRDPSTATAAAPCESSSAEKVRPIAAWTP